MSKKEHNKYFIFVLERDGALCHRCRKSVEQLKSEWELINPNKVRKSPYLYLHHKDGDERFPDSRDGRYAGNLHLLCASCQQLLRVKKIVSDTPRQKTPEMQRSDFAQPKFFTWLDNYLANFSEVCKTLMLNRGSKIAGVGQHAVKRYFDQNIGFKYIQFHKVDHGIICNYPECNEYHICLKSELPRKVDLIGKIIDEEPQFSNIETQVESNGKKD